MNTSHTVTIWGVSGPSFVTDPNDLNVARLWGTIFGPYETAATVSELARQRGVSLHAYVRDSVLLATSQGFECDAEQAYCALCDKLAIGSRPERPSWGARIDRLSLAAWGARAIWNERQYVEREPLPGPKPRSRKAKDAARRYIAVIDLLWDRQESVGLPGHKQILHTWLNAYGLDAMRTLVVDEGLHQDEERVLSVEGFDPDGNHLRLIASPQRSFGYLYLCGMLLRVAQKGA